MFQNSRETYYFKKETLRGNHARFVSKELTKVIYTRSRFRYRYLKNLDEIKLYNEKNLQAGVKQVCLHSKKIKYFFSNITRNGIITNKKFWKAIKPFLTNKGCLMRKN